MGPIGGLIAGYAILVDFLLATPAIAFALGSYIHFLYAGIPILTASIACYAIFTTINLLGIKESANFSLFVTVIAILGLLIFISVTAPQFKTANFLNNNMPNGWSGVFAALPFAVWLYSGIEGVAMVAEEVKDPKKSIPIAYIMGILTLTALAVGVMVTAGGITDWQKMTKMDYPLPQAFAIAVGKENGITKLFAGIGLFGLIASFHGNILSYSRQMFALARSGYLPTFLSKLHPRFLTPHWALIVGALIGVLAVCSGTTDQLIILSALGVVSVYIISMISLYLLRINEPTLYRPFKSPFYPVFPLIALSLSLLCLFAFCWFNPLISALYFSMLGVIIIIFISLGKHKQNLTAQSDITIIKNP